ncbi:DUF177 domain-containing protein [Phenylobacterium sp.]|uniref:YceD family protein n=1 Tax=Phenylobacterium sp. TaxID=1871053 RepID=UPI002730A36B|nr:DUF177 domain-containing protein [Phenylobacterium sp.]MDP1874594.1 DUF177 domain-containing protein [Phenylobacterium sp.]
MNETPIWSHRFRMADLSRGPVVLSLEADSATRDSLASHLGLRVIKSLVAEARIRPWLDGAEISGRFEALIEQESGISLEIFDQVVAGPLEVRLVPAGSPNAPDPEIELDPEAPDPPEILDGDIIDVAAYVVEHLAVEIDPFPRQPGETFEYVSPQDDDSPFAVLKRLKDDNG